MLIQNSIYRTSDRGKTRRLVEQTGKDSFLSIGSSGQTLYALAANRILLSTDGGLVWTEIPAPPLGQHVLPRYLAADGDSLAIATSLGRIYTSSRPWSDWREWIVGPVHDLTYANGRLYAITNMGTLAVWEGESMEHIKTTDDWGRQQKLTQQGSHLYLYSGRGLFEVDAGTLKPIAGSFSAQLGGYDQVTVLSPDEALAMTASPEHTVLLHRVDLRSGQVEEMGPLP